MFRSFFLPVRTPVRLVKNEICAAGNNGGSTVVCEIILHSEHDQCFSSTRKGRKIHMGLSRHFCPIKLPSSGNLEYLPNFSVTLTEKISNFPRFNILLYSNYFMFPWHFPENLAKFAEEFPVKQALDLGHLRVAILPTRECIYGCYIFQGNVFNMQNWLKGYELYTILVDNLTRTWQGTWMKRFFPYGVLWRLASLNRDFKKPQRQRQRNLTSLEKLNLRYLYYFAIIPIRSTCTMWPNYSVTEQVETAFKLRQRLTNLPSRAHVLHKALNLVISRWGLAEHGGKMMVPKFITHVQGLCFSP